MPATAPPSDTPTRLTLLVAATSAGVIGSEGSMPWRLGSDLARFKKLTMGGVLIMGRKTFDSIGRPLPGRRSVVISRNSSRRHEGVFIANSPEQALARLQADGGPGYVIGGAEIYRLMMPWVSEIWLTRVWSSAGGDTRIELPPDDFRLVEVQRLPQGNRDSVPTELQRWVKKSVPNWDVPIESPAA